MGFTFRISPQSFFQVNPAQAEVLYAKAVELAGLTRQDLALDLYCGTGTIALALARQAGRVIGVESVPAAVADAKVNAARHGLTHVEFVLARAEEWLPEFVAATPVPPAAAVIDPPRRGCDPSLLTVSYIPCALVYISCNPGYTGREPAELSPAYTHRTVFPSTSSPGQTL
jgi:23S rRNA (uracil1939-C5)-methyltransferase